MSVIRSRHKVRWVQVVPRKSDRRELRRSFRAVSRSFYQEQESQLRTALAGLAACRACVAAVRLLRSGNEVIEFTGGTRLEIDVHESSADPQYLACSRGRPVYLVSARPSYRSGWYWLVFASPCGEVTAYVRVDLYESCDRRLRRPRDRWLYRLGLMVAKL